MGGGGGGSGGEATNLSNNNSKVPPLKIIISSRSFGGSNPSSSSSSPSSESESLDSNLTIISADNPQERTSRPDSKEAPTVHSKYDKQARHTVRGASGGGGGGGNGGGGGGSSGGEMRGAFNSVTSVATSIVTGANKRTHQDHNCDDNSESTATRESTPSGSSQRITRSSQRAAQQNSTNNNNNNHNRPDSNNFNETNGDETSSADMTQADKSNSETSQRKVKRRKGEQVESLDESNQQVQAQPVLMTSICPTDYQLPSQNSFELYRDIRNRPHMKLMNLNLIPPKVPHGFRDFIIYGGPYLLEGNKVGLGLSGGRIDSPLKANHGTPSCMTAKMKLSSNMQRRLSSFNHRHSSYIIPKLLETPKNLKAGSALHELFQDQERSRQKMRMQHLKERERSVLTCEQEILRAYNQGTIADREQKLHLSACTFFYYHERYHYVDEKNNYLDSINQKDSSQSRENSDSCNAETHGTTTTTGRATNDKDHQGQTKVPTNESELADKSTRPTGNEPKSDKDPAKSGADQSSNVNDVTEGKNMPKRRKGSDQPEQKVETKTGDSRRACDMDLNKVVKSSDDPTNKEPDSKGSEAIDNGSSDGQNPSDTKPASASSSGDNTCKVNADQTGEAAAAAMVPDQREINRAAFLDDLQKIDNKWAKIKDEMFIRHKNESDSLYAVQCLEWEWKAKETGTCDVRLSLKVEPEFVPRVVVSAQDY